MWPKSVGASASTPVIDAGPLFVSSDSVETALATNNRTPVVAGRPCGRDSLAGARRADPPRRQGRDYAGTAGGKLAAYATINGSSLYSTTVDAAALTVNVIEDGSTVYATTSTGKVAAYRTS